MLIYSNYSQDTPLNICIPLIVLFMLLVLWVYHFRIRWGWIMFKMQPYLQGKKRVKKTNFSPIFCFYWFLVSQPDCIIRRRKICCNLREQRSKVGGNIISGFNIAKTSTNFSDTFWRRIKKKKRGTKWGLINISDYGLL